MAFELCIKQPKVHIPFDRRATAPSDYLNRLRSKGSRRRFSLGWHHVYGNGWNPMLKELHSVGFNQLLWFTDYRVKRGSVFLDAGCGNSPDALIARKRGFKTAYGVDLYEPSYEYRTDWKGDRLLKEMNRRLKPQFIKGDICERLPLDDESVDVVVSSAVLDLMPDEDRILFYKEALRLLKPGGYLSVYVCNLANGYGVTAIFERDVCTMPGWGINFELVWDNSVGFVVRKPLA